jgi:selenocysteine lyase/cysteine desulfurase
VSAVQFQTGLRMPVLALADLCHAYGAEIFVDGIQALGALPCEDLAAHVDYLSCGSHKWLMGLEGVGFVYVHPERAAALRPWQAGWLSHEAATGFLFEGEGHLRYDRPLKRTAEVFEAGAQNAAGLVALEASVGLIAQLGPAAIHAHVGAWLDLLEAGLVARGFRSLRAPRPEARSNILSLLPPPGVDLPGLLRALHRRGVVAAMPDGRLRFGPHWPNALSEVPAVLDALDEGMSDRGP